MNSLVDIRYKFNRSLPILVGVCLCLYFSYHSVSGDRSYSRLSDLMLSMQQKTSALNALEKKREKIELRVSMMRPSSLSKDLLEEQAVLMLGYNGKGDIVVLSD